ncbi:MAG: SDR family oxidoreductase [Anaerolineae bacterium]|jgi:NAD(P)-dependent dehydrogenase (short-subunit alcohol dehydrogenase family)|nr:SDR family oxidoreductase [Anaerolineae bacterium]
MEEKIFGKRFVGQVALVTGAAKGIGEACALRFAKEGANVALLDFDDANNEKAAAACRAQGVEALAIHCDVSSKESVQAAVDQVMQKWGRIDAVVASAGVYSGLMLPDVTLAQWQRTIDINLTGVFLTNQAVAPILMKQKSGSIVNISSMAGKTSWPSSAEYSASKSGVIGLTRSVAVELAPYGVTCNAICPGNTLTDMVRNVAALVGGRDGLNAEEWLAMRAKDSPAQRLAEPWEIGGVATFLASNDARYLNGQALEVDGGMVMS